jgi:hypothetical protein
MSNKRLYEERIKKILAKTELDATERKGLIWIFRKAALDKFPLYDYFLWEIPLHGDKTIYCFFHEDEYESVKDLKYSSGAKFHSIAFVCYFDKGIVKPYNEEREETVKTCQKAVVLN